MKKFVAGSAVVLGLASASAMAGPVYQLKSNAGLGTLLLKTSFAEAIRMASLEADATHPAKILSREDAPYLKLRLPVSGGVVDLAGVFGEINHAGGFGFTALDGSNVQFHNLVLQASESAVQVSGMVEVDGNIVGRQVLFDVMTDSSDFKVKRNGRLATGTIVLALTQEASDLLNTELGVFIPAGEEVAKLKEELMWVPEIKNGHCLQQCPFCYANLSTSTQ